MGYQLTKPEKRLYRLINKKRRLVGVKPLTFGGRLGKAARRHSSDMVAGNYFSHTSPTGENLPDRLKRAGVKDWQATSETLAGAPDAKTAFRTLMQSPRHKAALLSKKFTNVGVGVKRGGRYGSMFTVDLVERPPN